MFRVLGLRALQGPFLAVGNQDIAVPLAYHAKEVALIPPRE